MNWRKEEYKRGVIDGLRMAARIGASRTREIAEFRYRSVILYPHRLWGMVVVVGAVLELAAASGAPRALAWVGFVLLLVGVTAQC